MKHRKVIGLIALVMLLACLTTIPVLAQPPVCQYKGTVTLDGASVAAGTLITAELTNGTEVGATTAYVEGGVSKYNMMVAQADSVPAEGATLKFYVNGYLGNTSTWTSGGTKTLTLAAVTGAAVPPTIVTQAATNIGETTARTNYNLTDLGTATTVACHIELGLTEATDDWASTPANRTTTGSSGVNWIDLEPDTTYYFRAVAVGDGTDYGNVLSFTTLEEGEEPPAATFAWWLYETFVECL
jgi:hypothetical protein